MKALIGCFSEASKRNDHLVNALWIAYCGNQTRTSTSFKPFTNGCDASKIRLDSVLIV